MEIVVSTLALMGRPAEEIISIAARHSWAMEFSSGMPYRADMEKIFLEAPVKKYAHNYFPAPEIPFVLNLASADEKIRSASVQHCIRGLELSAKAGAPFFSAHAGFCVDPHPDELGRKLALGAPIDRKKHWSIFLRSLKEVCDKAQALGLKFLVENNVLAAVNIHPDGTNPLFCCEPAEMLQMLREVAHPALGLLIDTAHLKVSANTLIFGEDEALEALAPHIGCIHHSDNDGSFDTNEKMPADYWFLKHLPTFAHITHVIEVKKLTEEEISQQINLLR